MVQGPCHRLTQRQIVTGNPGKLKMSWNFVITKTKGLGGATKWGNRAPPPPPHQDGKTLYAPSRFGGNLNCAPLQYG